jgi:hypothetical protein
MPPGFPFLISPDRIHRHNLPLRCLEHLRVIKTGCRTPPLHIAPRRKTNIVPRRLRGSHSRDRPPSRAPHRFWSDFVSVFYLGELAMFPTPSRYLLIIEWCSNSSFRVLRRWRRRESHRCGSVPAEHRHRLFPIQSEPSILNPTAADGGYRFGCAFC